MEREIACDLLLQAFKGGAGLGGDQAKRQVVGVFVFHSLLHPLPIPTRFPPEQFPLTLIFDSLN